MSAAILFLALFQTRTNASTRTVTACTSARTRGATTRAVACRDTNWTVTTTTVLVRIPCFESIRIS